MEIITPSGDEMTVTIAEFELLKRVLGDPVAVSNCCSVEIRGGISYTTDDLLGDVSRCPYCGEGCGVVYDFQNVLD